MARSFPDEDEQMSLIDKTVPYEILIRFDEEGIPKGAHVQYRRIVVLDDERLKDEPLPAQPLDLAGLDASELIGDVAAAALARVTELERDKEALLEDIEAEQANNADLQAQLDAALAAAAASEDDSPVAGQG
jgi:hypothetical protein